MSGGVNPLVSLPPPRRPRPWWRQRRWLAALVAALLVAGGAIRQQQKSGVASRNLEPYTVLARSGELPAVVNATGELDAVERVNVSPKRQGLILELLVDEGDRVQRGQALARMDPGDLPDREQELLASLQSAEAELRRSASELRRNEPLYRQGAISLNDLNRFRADEEVKRMAVNAARQRFEQRRVEAAELVVRAPFAGVISQRFADPGAFVTPTTTASASAGATSSSIVELSQGLEVLAKVPESDLGRLRIGQLASVRVDAFPARRYEARIRQIAPRGVKTNNVNSFVVKLAFTNLAPELRIGMTADIDVRTGQLEARTLVPTVAVVTEGGRPGVLLVDKDRQPRFSPVELGVSMGRDTQILSGLEPGSRVFIDLPPWAPKKRS